MNSRRLICCWFIAWSGFAASACASLGGSLGGSSLAARCGQGLDMFQQARCNGIAPTATLRPTVQAELGRLKAECTDPGSQARIAQLEQSCVAGYYASEKGEVDRREEIRRRYATQVEAVKADPAYRPRLEAWIRARDDAQVAEDQWINLGARNTYSPYYRILEEKKQRLAEQSQVMRELLQTHGVDPKYARVLGLW